MSARRQDRRRASRRAPLRVQSPRTMAKKKTNTPATERPNQQAAGGWRAYKLEIQFLLLFVLILGGGFTLLSLNWVNDHAVEPFTGGVAKASGVALKVIGQDIEMRGTIIRSPKFAVNIKNGCNGIETMIIFLAAVLAFPSPWKARGIGLVLGFLAIQAINLVRVVALFLTGAYFPALFDSSHTVIWQTIVILCGVLLWIFWANRFATAPARPAAAE